MEPWESLEIEYGRRLRASTRTERQSLYSEAYAAVAQARMAGFTSADPEKRTAGTSPALVEILARVCRRTDAVLEVGCGRGYTCWKLAPHVRSIVGTDVSEPSLEEARRLLQQEAVPNAAIVQAGADELTAHFAPGSFDKVISIEVYEHLHPEDAARHLQQVYAVLKDQGACIIVTPNRLNGPADVTRTVFPQARQPLGFHLNETTNAELIGQLCQAGFGRIRSALPLPAKFRSRRDLWYPAWLSCWAESWHPRFKSWGLSRLTDHLLGIIVMAVKCGSPETGQHQ